MPTKKQYLKMVQGDWTASELVVSYKSGVKFSNTVHNAETAYSIIEPLWDHNIINLQEQFLAIYLNTRGKVIGYRFLCTGNMTSTLADVRLLVSLALHCMATSVIIAHNHPAGTLTATKADIELTAQIKQALKSIDVILNDHLIIVAGGWMSMDKEGLL